MTPAFNGPGGDVPLKLPPVLDASAAEALRKSISRRLERGGVLDLDASAVEVLTLPCVPVVLAAIKSADGVAVENPSPVFSSVCEELGLDLSGHRRAGSDQQRREPAAEQAETIPRKRILTIDDSRTIRQMLLLTLDGAGYEVLQAADGQEGIDLLAREDVDVVITDINMPRLDGYDVIRRMRANPYHQSTPILVLTMEGDADKKNLAREIGATGWVVKPFDPHRLIETIRKVAP